MFSYVGALTSVEEIRLALRRRKMMFYPDAGHAIS